MNQVFDFNRWLLLVGKHWSENRKKYLLSLVAIAALMVIWFSFILLIERYDPYSDEMQVATYYIGLGIAGCLFGSLLFAEAASGPKAMHFISVPASAFEKLLCALFYGMVLFFICFTVIFYLVDFTMVNVANSFLDNYWKEHDPTFVQRPMEVVNIFSGPAGTDEEIPDIFFYFLVIYFNLQAAFILGSLYFPGYSFIKTCISLLVVFLFIVFLVGNILDGFMPSGSFSDGFFVYRVNENGNYNRAAMLPGWVANFFKYLFMYGFLPLFWAAAYYRLKEKEV